MKNVNGNWSIIKKIEKDSGKSVKVEGYYQTITEVIFYDHKDENDK